MTERREELVAGLARVRDRIAATCAETGRDPEEITLVVVTKFFPASDVRLLADLGVRHVGENRHQEAVAKAEECADLDLTWHFIGGLQSNKAAAVAAYADVVQSLDRAKLVPGLSRGAQERGRELEVLLQVSLDPPGAAGRSGADPADVPDILQRVTEAEGLALRGVMGVAPLERRPRRGLRPAGRAGRRRTTHRACGDVDLRRHERRPGGGRETRCDTPADWLRDPRCEALGQVMSQVPAEAPEPATDSDRSRRAHRDESRGNEKMSAMRKMGVYLGLLEDAEGDYVDVDYDEQPSRHAEPEPSRPVANLAERRRPMPPAQRSASPAATSVAPLSRITTLHPRTYNEARVIGENFRDGVPVIMNLSEMDDTDAKRLVDFAAGLVFSVRGTIERVTNKVFLLSPPNVSVAAEDKQRIAENGFFNQS